MIVLKQQRMLSRDHMMKNFTGKFSKLTEYYLIPSFAQSAPVFASNILNINTYSYWSINISIFHNNYLKFLDQGCPTYDPQAIFHCLNFLKLQRFFK